MIKKLFLTLVFSFICLFAYADTVTYYFNAYDSGGEEWENTPADMVDGNEATNANAFWETGMVQLNNGNNCAGTDLGTISKVEIRALRNGIASNQEIVYRPVFGGSSDGNDHAQATGTSKAWGAYIDITSDTNSPETWTWTNVRDLDIDVVANTGFIAAINCYEVEIRVTYTGGAAARRRIIMVE